MIPSFGIFLMNCNTAHVFFYQYVMYLTDTLEYFQLLNLPLERREKNITDLVQSIFCFQKKTATFLG